MDRNQQVLKSLLIPLEVNYPFSNEIFYSLYQSTTKDNVEKSNDLIKVLKKSRENCAKKQLNTFITAYDALITIRNNIIHNSNKDYNEEAKSFLSNLKILKGLIPIDEIYRTNLFNVYLQYIEIVISNSFDQSDKDTTKTDEATKTNNDNEPQTPPVDTSYNPTVETPIEIKGIPLTQLRHSLFKFDQVIIATGKHQGKKAFFMGWNGTNAHFKIEGLSDKIPISNRNHVQVLNLKLPEHLISPLFNKPIEKGSILYSIKHIDFESFDQPIIPGDIPESVTFLKLSSFKHSIVPGAIPKSVKDLLLASFNQDIYIGAIPNSVTNLSLTAFNQLIKIGSIPNSVKNLTLISFNQQIEIGSIPNSVTNLTLPSYNQLIIPRTIPNSVNNLTLTSYNQPITIESFPHGITNLILPSFDQFIEPGSIPASVKELVLSMSNHPICPLSIPDSVTNLTLTKYNKPIEPISIPDSVTKLMLSSFNHPITIESFPRGVVSLTLPLFNQPIGPGSIPDRITSLNLSSFNHQIKPKVIPDYVEELVLSTYDQDLKHGMIPNSVGVLTLGSNSNQIGSLFKIQLSSLKLGIDYSPDMRRNITKYINPSLRSLTFNGKKVDFMSLFIDEYASKHLESDWEKPNTNGKHKKRNGNDNIEAEKLNSSEFCILYRLKGNTNIQTYHGIGKDEFGEIYLYKECLDDLSISKQLPTTGFSEDEIVSLAIEMAGALKLIHGNQIIHGRVNCDNIALVEGNKVKFFGFGSSAIFNNSEKPEHKPQLGKSNYKTHVNVLENNEESYKTDIWNLGLTLITMAGGDPSKKDDNNIPMIPDHLSNGFKNIIQHCLVINHYGRFDAKTLYDRLLLKGVLVQTISKPSDSDLHKTLVLPFELHENVFTNRLVPSSITHLTLKDLDQLIPIDSIPPSVTYLDLGDKYNLLAYSRNLPSDSILTLKCGFNYDPETITIEPKSIPESVTDLQLHNYNSKLVRESIPSSVVSLVLGKGFNDLVSLLNLPLSIIDLKFGTVLTQFDIDKYIKKYSTTSLIVNGVNIKSKLAANSISKPSPTNNTSLNSVLTKIPEKELIPHKEMEWITSDLGNNLFKATKMNGVINYFPVTHCVIQKIEKDKFRLTEIDVLKKLSDSEYSVKYYGYGFDKHHYYVYTEYNDRYTSISDTLKNKPRKRFETDEIKSLAIEIIKALHFTHQNNIIHRDFKGDNILLVHDAKGKIVGVKLTGYSISKIFGGNSFHSIVGTETHMAPEVKLQNAKVSFSSDVYSLGCTLIEMAGGNLKSKDTNGVPIIPDHLPSSLKYLIQRCIVTNPKARLTTGSLYGLLSNDKQKLESIKPVSKQYDYNEPLVFGMIEDGIEKLSLPSFKNDIKIDSIPSSVTHLTFKVLNQEIPIDSIPPSVTYLDLGDEFDLKTHGFNLPSDSILTLRCGFGFNKETIITQRSIPSSVTDLQLHNYNSKLSRNSIPSSVVSLELGDKFNEFDSLSNLPSSILNLKFSTYKKDIDVSKINSSITSLIINGEQKRK